MVKPGTICRRCGEHFACMRWREKLDVCEHCWAALGEWAEHLEWSIRIRIEQNREMREAAQRRVDGGNVVQLFKSR
jgi:hypothetical protein